MIIMMMMMMMVVVVVLTVQCRIIHEHGYTPEECLTYRPVVYSNVTQSLVAIVRAAGQLSIDFEHPDRAVRPNIVPNINIKSELKDTLIIFVC